MAASDAKNPIYSSYYKLLVEFSLESKVLFEAIKQSFLLTFDSVYSKSVTKDIPAL